MTSDYLLLLLLLFPLLLFLKFKSTSLKYSYRLPPGPWTIPIIGSIHHLVGAGHPLHVLWNLSRRYGDIMFLQLGELPTIVVSSKEAAREILKTHDLAFCNRAALSTAKILFYDAKDLGFAPYGEHWRELRKICVLELLSSKQVQSFRSIREDEVRGMIQRIASEASSGTKIVNITEESLVLTNNIVLRAIMGSRIREQKMVLDDILKAFDLVTGFNLANLFPSSSIASLISRGKRKAKECHRSFDQLLDNIIREHREEADDDAVDLLRVLLKLHDGSGNNSLTIDMIKAVILDLITSGTDTTSVTLNWAMAELIKNPRVMKKAQDEVRQQFQGHEDITELDLAKLNYLHLVIKEILRLHPAGPLIPRECRETCTIFGYDIPKGTNVVVNIWALGRDSRYWKDAEEFKPERFTDDNSNVDFKGQDFELIPFGAGRRMCPGMSFATAILEVALANLLYHFNWELPFGMKPEELEVADGFTARRKAPLLLNAQPYIAIDK